MNIKLKIRKQLCPLVAGAFLLMIVGACSGDEAERTPSGSTLCPGGVSVGSYEARNTREANGGFILLQEGVTGISRQSGGALHDNLPYAYDTPWRALANGILLTETVSQLAAYYPYDGRTGDSGIYSGTGSSATLHLSPCLYTPDKDVCAGTFDASADNAAPVVLLQHLYARVSFRFVKQLTYKGDGKISMLAVTSYPSGTYGLFSGSVTPAGKGEVAFSVNTTASGTDDTVDVLLVPDGNAADGIPFTFVIDNPTPGTDDDKYRYKGVIPTSLLSITENALKAGWHYRLKIVLGTDGYIVQPDGSPVPGMGNWNEAVVDGDYEVGEDDTDISGVNVGSWNEATVDGDYEVAVDNKQ